LHILAFAAYFARVAYASLHILDFLHYPFVHFRQVVKNLKDYELLPMIMKFYIVHTDQRPPGRHIKSFTTASLITWAWNSRQFQGPSTYYTFLLLVSCYQGWMEIEWST
jgi:hypothetical protein